MKKTAFLTLMLINFFLARSYAQAYGTEEACVKSSTHDYPQTNNGDGTISIDECVTSYINCDDMIGTTNCSYFGTFIDPDAHFDCAGVFNGTADWDICGCVGGITGLEPGYCLPVDPPTDPEPPTDEEACCAITMGDWQSENVSIPEGDVCGLVGVDPATGRNIKTCTHTWTFSKNMISKYLRIWRWSYASIETYESEQINNEWLFKSIQHTTTSEAGNKPPCISFSCTVNSQVASIAASRKLGQMNLTYTLSMKVNCVPWQTDPENSIHTGSSQWLPVQ